MSQLFPTRVVAKSTGVPAKVVQRWVREGHLRPDWTSPGGVFYWDLDNFRDQLRLGADVTLSTAS